MQASPIQWTNATWNPLLGCRRVSSGCLNCYAERLIATRMSKNPKLPMYHDIARLTEKREPRFTGNRKILPDRLDEPLRARKGRKIFVCDMGDLFFEGHPFRDIAAVWGVMAAAAQHTFQVLTKRPEQALAFVEWAERLGRSIGANAAEVCIIEAINFGADVDRVSHPWPLPNVHVGVSVEDQPAADKRFTLLRQVPAAVRFLSCEPLLEDLGRLDLIGINWVIAGGESGPGARPCDLAWLRSLRDQCAAAGVPFFAKQLGAHVLWDGMSRPGEHWPSSVRAVEHLDDVGARVVDNRWRMRLSDKHGGNPAEWPADLVVREFPRSPGRLGTAKDCVEAELEEDARRRLFEDLDDEDSWDLQGDEGALVASPPPEREPRGRSHSVPPEMTEDDIKW